MESANFAHRRSGESHNAAGNDAEEGEDESESSSSNATQQQVPDASASPAPSSSSSSASASARQSPERLPAAGEKGKVEDSATTSTTSSSESNDELEVSGMCGLEHQLEQFRIQWRKEMRGDSEDGTEGRSDAILKEKETEQEALFLYRQGVREEKRGNMYSAVMMYRRAMQLVPDIESRVPELREMKKSYRRRRRASSGGSTSEPEGNAETKEQRVGAEEEEKQETIIEAEEESTQNAPADAENCFTIPDSDDFGQRDDLDLLGSKLRPAPVDARDETETKEEEVIPPGVSLVDFITTKRQKSSDPGDKLSCKPDVALSVGDTHFSHLPPEIVVYILQWILSEDCDVRSLERFSAVCRGFYLYARDKDLWKLLCQKMWTVECKGPKLLGYDSWRQMFIRRPHPIFDGIYIAKTSYVRQGDQSLGNSYRHWQLVEYFRYIRLFSDGFMFMLTTCDDPLTTIPKIKSRTTKYPGLMTGYYRSIDCDDGKERLCAVLTRAKTTTIAPSRRQRRGGGNAQYAEADDRSFHMELEMLCSGKKRLHSQLKWRSFSVHSVSRASGETNVSEFDLTNNSYPDLYFSRVKSYALSSVKPLQL